VGIDERHRGVDADVAQATEDEAAEVIVAETAEVAGLGAQDRERREGGARRAAALHAENRELDPSLVEARRDTQQITCRKAYPHDDAREAGVGLSLAFDASLR
jgi:hypothetical protein